MKKQALDSQRLICAEVLVLFRLKLLIDTGIACISRLEITMLNFGFPLWSEIKIQIE
jgi:hypothetical protein